MRRSLLLIPLIAVLGCAQQQTSMDMMTEKPKPAPELAKLDRLVGQWSGTAEMVYPSPEEMRKKMPPGEEMPTYFKGGGKWEWVLGGMFLKSEGWHEMPGGERAHYLEFLTWDPTIKKYHSWYFSDTGESGEGTVTFSDDGRIMYWKAKGIKPGGKKMQGHGTMTFIDDNTLEWNWTESEGLFGTNKMELKGTSRRQR